MVKENDTSVVGVLTILLLFFCPSALGLCLRSSRSLSQLAELPETHQILRQTCRDYADRELTPIAAKLDKEQVYPAKQVDTHQQAYICIMLCLLSACLFCTWMSLVVDLRF